ncbi:MAG: hypothetical protein ACXVCY_04165 [Pseudobdellovibrionaceae bacterium]
MAGKKDNQIMDFTETTISEAPVQECPKVHVDLYLTYTKVPMWERGGKRAFAKSKGKEHASYDEFIELFKNY